MGKGSPKLILTLGINIITDFFFRENFASSLLYERDFP